MLEWIGALSNPQRVLAVYGGEPPALGAVYIHEVCLNNEGPSLRIRFDLSEPPKRLPEKWRRDGLNVVQLEILFGGLEKIEIGYFSTDPVCDFEIRKRGTEVHFAADSDVVRLLGVAKAVTVVRISAHAEW
ncbi:Imm50 family immunity protein [Salinispora arenicola]|uniref:Immunity protein 50 of polymorphic toxin system n=1 Tax=Salinispora arenicola TaxID=168697 RepID=A0A542XQ00_SALAC|nr:Imm50 family immunity protein [Salinispora arenicola]TQL37882.1 immunity protein 50 of polymorphic toxin system [Salinispora arenicola]GIM85845.1 hypothetical protein Sar04_25810 [Salinispora arenicola]